MLVRLKNFIKRVLNFFRRRIFLSSRVSMLENEVYNLKQQMDMMSLFYEQRLDSVLSRLEEKK